MELMQLRYFMAVARTENMSRAAETLYVSQPTLSRSIGRLEKDLDIQLFYRTSNRIYLTEAGMRYYEAVKAAFDELDRGLSDARRLVKKGKKINVVSTIGVLSRLAEDYMAEHPFTEIVTALTDEREVASQVISGKAVFGISLEPLQGKHLRNERLMLGGFYLVAACSQEFYDRKAVSLQELTGHVLFCSRYGNTRSLIENQFARHGLPGNIMELDEREILFDAAVKRLGYSICIPMLNLYYGSRVENQTRFIPITECENAGEIILVTRDDSITIPELEFYLTYIRTFFKENQASLRKL